MAEEVPLGTKIPAELHQRVKLFCVAKNRKIWEFVRDALEEKLAREAVASPANVVPIRKTSD